MSNKSPEYLKPRPLRVIDLTRYRETGQMVAPRVPVLGREILPPRDFLKPQREDRMSGRPAKIMAVGLTALAFTAAILVACDEYRLTHQPFTNQVQNPALDQENARLESELIRRLGVDLNDRPFVPPASTPFPTPPSPTTLRVIRSIEMPNTGAK